MEYTYYIIGAVALLLLILIIWWFYPRNSGYDWRRPKEWDEKPLPDDDDLLQAPESRLGAIDAPKTPTL
jgi:hypothetical protein